MHGLHNPATYILTLVSTIVRNTPHFAAELEVREVRAQARVCAPTPRLLIPAGLESNVGFGVGFGFRQCFNIRGQGNIGSSVALEPSS